MAILKHVLRLSAALPLLAYGYALPAAAQKLQNPGKNFVDERSFNDRGGRGNRGSRGNRGNRGGGQVRNLRADERILQGGGQFTQVHHRGRRGNFRGGRRGNFRGGRGFNRGFDRGFNRGFRRGRRQGFNRGFNRGLNRGFNRGFRPGFRRGFNRGFYPGFRSNGFFVNRFYGFRPYQGFNGYYGQRFSPIVGFNYAPAYAIGGFYTIGANTIIINDFGGYGLYAPPAGYHWVCDKGANDAILASVATGAIIGLAVGVLADNGAY